MRPRQSQSINTDTEFIVVIQSVYEICNRNSQLLLDALKTTTLFSNPEIKVFTIGYFILDVMNVFDNY